MAAFLTLDDLRVFAPDIPAAKGVQLIADATALAEMVAPCIAEVGFTSTAAVRAILREAILRRHEAGSGAVQTQTAGPFSQTLDTRNERRVLFWPSEIAQLQSLCSTSGLYTVSLAGP